MNKKKILFHIIKPLNPIDLWNYEVTKKWSLNTKALHVIKSFNRFFSERKKEHLYFGLNVLIVLIKHLILNFFSILYFPIALIFYLLNIKFLHVSYWQIGTLVFQVDILIKKLLIENQNINLKKIVFISPKMFSSNIGVNDLYKKKITVVENFFLGFLLLTLLQYSKITINPFFIEHNIPGSKSHKIYTEYEKKINNPLYEYNSEEVEFYEQRIKNEIPDLGKKKLVCLHLRNENFYSESGLVSRNADFKNYLSSINYLIENDYFIIQFTDERLPFEKKNFYQLLTKKNSHKKLQIYLIKKCDFFICSASGPSFIGNLFKKPALCTNFFPLTQMIGYNKFDITIPKKVYSILEEKYLDYNEIFLQKKYFISSSRILERNNLEVHQNSEENILSGVKEMIHNLENKKVNPTKEQIDFKKIIPPDAGCYYGQGQISQSFLLYNKK